MDYLYLKTIKKLQFISKLLCMDLEGVGVFTFTFNMLDRISKTR